MNNKHVNLCWKSKQTKQNKNKRCDIINIPAHRGDGDENTNRTILLSCDILQKLDIYIVD